MSAPNKPLIPQSESVQPDTKEIIPTDQFPFVIHSLTLTFMTEYIYSYLIQNCTFHDRIPFEDDNILSLYNKIRTQALKVTRKALLESQLVEYD